MLLLSLVVNACLGVHKAPAWGLMPLSATPSPFSNVAGM